MLLGYERMSVKLPDYNNHLCLNLRCTWSLVTTTAHLGITLLAILIQTQRDTDSGDNSKVLTLPGVKYWRLPTNDYN